MIWKQNLLGAINTEISRRHNAIFAVHSIEQKEWGKFIVDDIFSTLHLYKPLKLDFVVIPVADQDKICVGTVLEKKGDIDMVRMNGMDGMTGFAGFTGKSRRVVCKEFGAGEIISFGFFGQLPVASVRFDDPSFDGKLVILEDLKPEIIDRDDPGLKTQQLDRNNDANKVDDTERKLARAKELEMIHADALAEAKEIEDMSNDTLVDDFERLIRGGAGHGYRRVVFMKKEMVKRMDRGDHL